MDRCAGDFSEMMRKQGATGDDWSDWDAHLPASPASSGHPEALSSFSLSHSLSKQTSDKFEAAEGKRPWPLAASACAGLMHKLKEKSHSVFL